VNFKIRYPARISKKEVSKYFDCLKKNLGTQLTSGFLTISQVGVKSRRQQFDQNCVF